MLSLHYSSPPRKPRRGVFVPAAASPVAKRVAPEGDPSGRIQKTLAYSCFMNNV